ncbi:penicillin-binding transpeptidase domain-containing protein [soil metagenome]
MDKKRVALVALGVVVVVALAGGVAWFGPWRDDDGGTAARPGIDESDPPVEAADAFAAAWQGGTLAKISFAPGSGDVPGFTAIIVSGLTAGNDERPTVAVTKVERSAASAGRASAVADVSWKLDGGLVWTYATRIPLVESKGTWKVAWSPAVIEPSLRAGEGLKVARVAATRGQVLDTSGASLAGTQGTVVVGIKKSRTQDPAGLARQVALLTGANPDELLGRVNAAGPDDFVEAATLARADYDKIRAEIQPLPGTVFREENAANGLPANYARAVLGSVGTATPEIIAASNGRVVQGDITGLKGLQASQDVRLSGTPGVTVQAVAQGATPRALKAFPPVPGTSITITLDQKIQTIADATVAATATPSALVAIRVSTGDVLAVANGPTGSDAYNRAMIGKYPPGSTFKVATTLGLLVNGLTPDTVVDCPATITVGKVFKNAGGEVLGAVPFRKDFAESCNTAFVGQQGSITPEQLTGAGAQLGYRSLDVGLPLFGGSIPATTDPTEHAANMIGQGKVEASPFAVALASASVASGTSLNPRLIVDPAKPDPVPGAVLPAAQIAQLRELMRGVVTDGTGSALAGVPGGDVFGKTGTAEFGTESPPHTHAWFTGYQGDIAFAVLVEDGGFGGEVAAPLAANFLTTLASGL